MPVDYKKYPPNWLSEIRPRILARAGNRCENADCRLPNYSLVYSVKFANKPVLWVSSKLQVLRLIDNCSVPITIKQVQVILTVAHLDHDAENHEIADSRLMALCQKCHFAYDLENRKISKSQNSNSLTL